MTKQEIYERIVQLTSELHATNVAEKIFSAAREGDAKKVEEVFETFKKENPDLYARIVSFGADFNSDENDTIDVFASEEDKENGAYVYDNNIINAVTFYALMLFAQIDEFYLFDWGTESSKKWVTAIKDAGYDELVNFINDSSVFDHINSNYTIYECLVDICLGKLEP